MPYARRFSRETSKTPYDDKRPRRPGRGLGSRREQDKALKKWFAQHPNFFPGYNMIEMNGEDGMHLFGDGLTTCIGYFVFNMLIVQMKLFSLKFANKHPQERQRQEAKEKWQDAADSSRHGQVCLGKRRLIRAVHPKLRRQQGLGGLEDSRGVGAHESTARVFK